ncbi:MAG: FAD-dependent oxidoreductase [Elusimicrobiota bacterium]|jgi:protoporphyrinogen oxidase|nr:FAD-dependent oxidoreductase [Elusimicrobiota bacterium]
MDKPIVIIGAGISGLSTAYFLKKQNIVLEAKPYVGGLCHSFYDNGFTFDCSGHFIHIRDKKILSLVKKLSGGVDEINRSSSILFKNTLVPFPFQANLYYLDAKTKKECIDGILKRKNVDICPRMPFIDWAEAMFGKGITKHFMRPYNEKLWSYDLKKMNAQWTGAFVPKPNAQEIIESAKTKNKTVYGYNNVFYYPKRNGCQALIDGISKKIKPLLNEATQKIDIKNKVVWTGGGKYKYSKLISTQPIVELLKQISPLPKNVQTAAQKLKFSSVRCINIGIKTKSGVPKILKGSHWIYVPQADISFYRVGIYSNVNPAMAPKKSYSLYVEISSSNGKYKRAQEVINDLQKLNFISQNDEIAAVNIVDIAYAYVIFDKDKDEALKTINEFLRANEIYSIGRYGAWEYSFIEKNILDAKALAETINRE